MRFLIGATCVAVIAFVGYFFWGEYEKSRSLARLEHETKQAKIRLDYEKSCWRIMDNHAQYDKNYIKTLKLVDYQNKIKECKVYMETGKLP